MLLHDLKRKVVLAPDDAEARCALGEALLAAEQLETATAQLEKAVALDPDHRRARSLLGRVYRRDGRGVKALRALEEAVRRWPEDAAARDDLADLLVSEGRIDEAILHLEEAIIVEPDDLGRRLLLADLSQRRGLLPRARGHVEHALRLAPERADLRSRLDEIAIELGEPGAALTSPLDRGRDFLLGRCRALLETPPLLGAASVGALRDAAVALRRMDVGSAKRALVGAEQAEQAQAIHPFLRGEIALIEGDRERSAKAFRRSLDLDPAFLPSLARLAEIAYAAGPPGEAILAYERVLERSPHDASALEAMGDLVADLGQTERAFELYTRASALEPGGPVAAKLARLRASRHRREARPSTIGRIGALGWNPLGGAVSMLEAVTVPGKGELIFTGNVGTTGQDAALVAFSCLKARAASLDIEAAIRSSDLHLHFVDTEMAKDGASAGVALFLAAASAYLKRPLLPALAATGEITLDGAVRAIAGLREKLIAATLAGVVVVLLPRKNLFDARELPKEVSRRLRLVYIDSIPEALEQVLAT